MIESSSKPLFSVTQTWFFFSYQCFDSGMVETSSWGIPMKSLNISSVIQSSLSLLPLGKARKSCESLFDYVVLSQG